MANLRPIQSTPVSHRFWSASHLGNNSPPSRDVRMAAHLNDGRPCTITGIEPLHFLEDFLSLTDAQERLTELKNHATFGELSEAVKGAINNKKKRESDMYKGLGPIFKKYEFFENMTFVCTASQKDKRATVDTRPDGAIYSNANVPPDGVQLSWDRVELAIEMKSTAAEDGFTDIPGMPIHSSIIGRKTAGQIMAYGNSHLSSTHRTHSFLLGLFDNFARFIRFDRSAIVVSTRFNYVESPELLLLFTRQFSQAKRADRGWDVTVEEVPPKDAEQFCQSHEHLAAEFDGKPLVRFKVPGPNSSELSFIGPKKPEFLVRCIAGRATRCFLVVQEGCAQHPSKRMYLKDAWRVDVDRMSREGDIYDKLHEHSVRNIMQAPAHGDLVGQWQNTCVEILRKRVGQRVAGLTPHRHYRMVMDVVARKLTEFRNSKELVRALYDCTEALHDAVTKANILHRDVSSGNILFCDDGEQSSGKMSDWDVSANLDRTDDPVRLGSRTGTWQFMSAALLMDGNATQSHEDDLESCVHVLTWMCLRYMRTTYSHNKTILRKHIKKLFEEVEDNGPDARPTGGDNKQRFFSNPRYLADFKILGNTPLTVLIFELRNLFQPRYKEDGNYGEIITGIKAGHDNPEAPAGGERTPVDAPALLCLFRAALDSDGWPVSDAAEDQLEGLTESTNTYACGASNPDVETPKRKHPYTVLNPQLPDVLVGTKSLSPLPPISPLAQYTRSDGKRARLK